MTKFKRKKLKRKFLKFSGTTILLLILSLGTVKNLNAQFGGGDGLSKATAYEIYTKAHLQELHDSMLVIIIPPFTNWTNGKHFRLMNDIDNVDFIIGGGIFYFQGHFHGGGNRITLEINASVSYVALFTGLGGGGSIDSLEVDGYVTNSASSGFAAGIVSHIIGMGNVVSNSTNNATITCNAFAGHGASGIINILPYGSLVLNCINNGTIISNFSGLAAGIATNVTGDVINSINNGKIIVTHNNNIAMGYDVGGVVSGTADNAKILGSLNLGTIEVNVITVGATGGIGGIVGGTYGKNAKISHNSNHGFIKSNRTTGGVVGFLSSGNTAENNFNSGVLEGATIGCIVGENAGGTIINNHYDEQMCGEED